MSVIKERYFNHISTQTRGSLAADLWPDMQPAMAIPEPHFNGRYPAEPTAPKVCKTRGFVSGVGATATSWGKAHFSQWRGYTHKSGAFIQPCQHCQHERVLESCEHIERASIQYSGPLLMRWLETTQTEKRAKMDVIRKRNERGASLYCVAFPLANGRYILLHDAPDIGGQALPSDRRELYHLVSDWVLQTPKGKRAGRGLSTWGKQPSNKEHTPQGEKSGNEGEGKRWRLVIEDYGKLAREIAAYEGTAVKPGQITIPTQQIIDRFEAAGIVWAVESGELPENVTLNAGKQKLFSAKCDNGTAVPVQTAVFSQGGLNIGQESGNEPAKIRPINLNGVIVL